MDFLAYLNDYESQDVSGVKDIVESRSTMNDNVLKEAFNSDFPSKREALFNVENYFTNAETTPECVDTKYVKENLSEIKEQINNLSEGDIRIIIHNHEDGKKEVEVEEGATPKRKPGRPKGSKGKKAVQTDFTKAPKGTTAVIYDEDETDKDSPVIEEEEKTEESVDDTLFDKNTKAKAEDTKEQIDEEDEEIVESESTIKWSDIVDAVSDEEEGEEPEEDGIDDKLIKDLAELDLTDEELKEIVDNVSAEDRGAKIDKAMDIVRKIQKK